MKITAVRAFPLVYSREIRQGNTTTLRPSLFATVMRVDTDAGISGWGESLARYTPTVWATLAEEVFAPLLVGHDPFDNEYLWDRMYRGLASFSGHSRGIVPEVIAGLDTALWDIKGKETGLPVHKLLGGYSREWIDCYGSSIGRNPIDKRIAETEAALEMGFRSLKIKIGDGIGADLAAVDAVRAVAGPDITLSVDANCAYQFRDAVRLAEGLYERNIIWFEEPLVTEDRAGYQKLRAACNIPLAAGEGEFTRWGMGELLATGAMDVIQPDVARTGGITETRKIADLASVHHCAYAPHIGACGAICATASLHLAASAPNFLSYECSTLNNPLRTELITEPFAEAERLHEGKLPVPQGPGLGVEIDLAALEKYTVR